MSETVPTAENAADALTPPTTSRIDQGVNNENKGAYLYASAEEARWAIAADAYAEGRQPHPHTWLGAICSEAECYCGIQMPLNEDGSPSLTFEEWLDYHDEAQMRMLAADELGDVDRIAQAEGWNIPPGV